MPLDAHATEEEDKLILLSSLSRLGGCTQEQLLRFLAESGLMNPFQFYPVSYTHLRAHET